MKTIEKLTLDQVRKMIDKQIEKTITDRNAETFIDKFAIRSGIIESMLDILIASDPTDMAVRLHLVQEKYVLTRFESETDSKGMFIAAFVSESLCKDFMDEYKIREPHLIFKMSRKILEK